MSQVQKTFSPIDGHLYVERPYATQADLEGALDRAERAQRPWRDLGLEARAEHVTALVARISADTPRLAEELTLQMGRPCRYAAGELSGFVDRAETMTRLAGTALADIELGPKPGFSRFIRREPLGVVLVLAPWNYPWLTAVNAVVPALLAGNTVLLKHSDQTPLVAERFVEAGREAGLPEGVFQSLNGTHERIAAAVGDPRVAYVAFTGSVGGGHAIYRNASERFIAVGLELGGKDPAYVRADADVGKSVEGIVDGAFFNSGQSCCGIERVYAHEAIFDDFVDQFAALTKDYVLGDPREQATTLGPVVRVRNAEAIVAQIDAAVAAGARALIDPAQFGEHALPYLAPQVLVDVDHSMEVMSEETFGPVVGIMKVKHDDAAIAHMNDSRYGLTASVWTSDLDRARALADRLETGTVFANRCDYLDPELAWTGVKDSGRGCTLSAVGFESLTRPKSFHLRHEP